MVSMQIVYEGKQKCTATHESSGTVIRTDAPKDIGGDGSSFSPTDLVATALATCIATTMGMFAERRGIDLAGMKVTVTKEMFTGTPRRIGALKATVTVPANKISESERELYERVGHSCPVHASLSSDVEAPISFVYE